MNATRTAVVVTPANINMMLNSRSQVGWCEEAEVAVAHRRDRLGAEVQRVDPGHPRRGW